MGSHQRPPLLEPRASIRTPAADAKSWYRINARAGGDVEIELYGDIGDYGVSAKSFAQELRDKGAMQAKRVDVRMHSYGGSVLDGFVIYNLLRGLPGDVHGWVDGVAASMMSVVAMACNTLHMPENAWLMIHKPWGGQVGDADDMREYADFLDRNEKNLLAAYSRKSGKSEDEIRAMLKPETWLSGRDAVEAGFADELTEPLAAAAQLTSQRFKEFTNMPDQLQALLAPRAHATTAPATPAAETQPAAQATAPAAAAPVSAAAPAAAAPQPAAPVAAVPATDAAAIRAQLVAEENQRRQGISALFQPFAAHGALLQECLGDMNTSVAQAQAKLLAKLGEGTTPTAPAAVIHTGNGNLVGDSVRNSVEARIGLVKAEKENKFVGMPLAELARASLLHRGIGIAGQDRMGIVGLAFTHSSSDFGHILGDIANKSMLKGYQEAEETFQKWTAKGTLTDFKATKRVDLTSFPNLSLVGEGAEYTHATMGDRAESIILGTYGKLFSISRQVVINDDLSALDRIPRSMGRAAIRTIGDLVYAVLGNNPKMSDGTALFHATHGNLLSPAAALSVGRIDAALSAMQTQEEGDAILNIMAKYMLVPVALRSTANALINAEFDPGNANAKVPNPVRGLVEVIADARLDKQSKLNTYFAADPAIHDTIEVAYLDGNEQPYMEQQQGFTVDGATFKVRMDAGVAPMSWRTINKVLGA